MTYTCLLPQLTNYLQSKVQVHSSGVNIFLEIPEF